MAIVNWESFYKSDGRDVNYFHVEVNNQTNAIRRVFYNVQPGLTLRVWVGEPHNIDQSVIATAVTGEQDGSQNIAGNEQLIDNGEYLEPPWEWSVSFMSNGQG